MVSTAPGLVRTTILVIAVGPDDRKKGWPLAKAYLRRGFLSKLERDAVHDYIVNAIDQSGRFVEIETNIGYALEGVFSVAKARGAIVDYIIAPSAKRDFG